MSTPPLSIKLDPAQDRLSVDTLSTLVSGRDWDPTASSADVWIDPVTNTAMLRPAPQYAAWSTTTTGIYAKYGRSDFSFLTDSGNWVDQAVDTGGPFMYYKATNTAGLQGTGPTLGINQAFAVEMFNQGATNSPYGILDVGVSGTADSTTGVALRFYADGKADVYKDGHKVGSYSISGGSPNYFDSYLAVAQQLGGGSVPQAPRAYQTIMVIPCRDRELLVISSQGGGFCHVFEDLPEGVPNQTITPNATLWFQVLQPAAANLRFAKLQYASTGFIVGYLSNWRKTPCATAIAAGPNKIVYQDLSSASLLPGTSLATLTVMDSLGGRPAPISPNPYALVNPVQLKLVLTHGTAPYWTPFVYGCRAAYGPDDTWTHVQTAAPGGGAIDLLPFVQSFHMEVNDTVGGTQISMVLHKPAAIDTAASYTTAITTQCQRPFQISDETWMIVNGVNDAPHWTDSYGFDAAGYDSNQEFEIVVRDWWKLAEEYMFSDPIPLDGLTLLRAYKLVAQMIGIPTSLVYVSASASSVTLQPCGTCSGGDFAVMIDVGDKGSEWLDRLHQTYASSWFHGFRPHAGGLPRLCMIDPADVTADGLPSSPGIILYPSLELAQAAGTGWQNVYRSYKIQVLEPEANDLCVSGRDPRTGKPIVAHKADSASQTVITAPGSRPSNWLGYIRKYGWIDSTLTTIGIVTQVLNLLFSRLTVTRTIIEFECEYMPGLWRGDLVQLNRVTGDPVIVRLKTFSGTVDHVAKSGDSTEYDMIWRPCKYVGEVGSLVCPLDVPGTNARSIGMNWNQLKALSKQRVFDGSEVIARRPVINRQEI